eukprot:TRINITY_DN3514_c0_g2_i1.p1 TRINITY_DN3514_c0_g2~~TRINITY_DN3514_c0_g2_i1.p1  ORF type:complete len:398 (+),score=66.76 TRINITY_DN3514_c0_g2_i1:54-1247(+)
MDIVAEHEATQTACHVLTCEDETVGSLVVKIAEQLQGEGVRVEAGGMWLRAAGSAEGLGSVDTPIAETGLDQVHNTVVVMSGSFREAGTSRVVGGGGCSSGGGRFDDSEAAGWGPVRQVHIRHDVYVNGIGLTYANGRHVSHGRLEGKGNVVVTLGPDEGIVRVKGRSGWYIDCLILETNKGRVYGPYGAKGGSDFGVVDFGNNNELLYITGEAGRYVDKLSFTYGVPKEVACLPVLRTAAHGGPVSEGNSFDDSVCALTWGPVRTIVVHAKNCVHSLGLGYENGQRLMHGAPDGVEEVVHLEEGEYITGVSGLAGPQLVYQLTFHTTRRLVGPFGTQGPAGERFFDDFGSDELVYLFGGDRAPGSNRPLLVRVGFGYGQPRASPTAPHDSSCIASG